MALSNKIVQVITEKAREQREPITVNFELLPVCNLDCKMCFIRSDWKRVERAGGLVPVEKWLSIAEELKDAGVLFILLTGGEVFLYPGFKDLYIALYKMGFALTINTNATMIDEEVVEWLVQYPPKCVSASLYGASNEVYEKLCGQKGMFDRLDNAMHLLKDRGIPVELKTVLTPLNRDDMLNCKEYTEKMHIPYEVAVYSYPPVRKEKGAEQIRFNAIDAAEVLLERNLLLGDETIFRGEIEKYLTKYEETRYIPGCDRCGFNCSASNTSCWINWKGDMIPCAMMLYPSSKPFEVGFLPAWEELKEKSDQIKLSSTCAHCDKRQICIVCPASAFAETGSFEGTSSYHCEMTEYLLKKMQGIKDTWE